MLSLNTLSQRFETFSKMECSGSSELYEFLALQIAQNNEMLNLCSHAREGQPVPNLLFGAVHYLLLKGAQHDLQEYYPTLTKYPLKASDSFRPFQDFCETYRAEIIRLIKSKLVQTNEVGRCSYLYPCFSHIYSKSNKSLALIEIGTSAGLQLFWDKYRYSYNVVKVYGNSDSNVMITAEYNGENEPSFSQINPPVSHRFGLDLHINDVSDPEDRLWLNALIWPEHHERRELFENASHYVNKNEAAFIEGDGVSLLPELIAKIPKEHMICVFHTHVANQIPENMKHQLQKNIKEIGQTRDISHIYNNMWDRQLHIDTYIEGLEATQVVGETDGHGKWFEWKL